MHTHTRALTDILSLSHPLQFSKEKYILDSSPEKLHKELEEELKLSSTDLRSHAWYHGRIPREVRMGRGGEGSSQPTQSHQAKASPAPNCLVLWAIPS